jgi:hypothetical protein
LSGISVREPFDFLPPIVYCLLLDAVDFLMTPLHLILTAIGGAGLLSDLTVDVLQVFSALLLFDGVEMALVPGLAAEGLLPPGFDLMPSFTAYYLLREKTGG